MRGHLENVIFERFVAVQSPASQRNRRRCFCIRSIRTEQCMSGQELLKTMFRVNEMLQVYMYVAQSWKPWHIVASVGDVIQSTMTPSSLQVRASASTQMQPGVLSVPRCAHMSYSQRRMYVIQSSPRRSRHSANTDSVDTQPQSVIVPDGLCKNIRCILQCE